jgi:hypothetical protein
MNQSVGRRGESFDEAARNWLCGATLSEVNSSSSSSRSGASGGGFNVFGYFGISGHGSSGSAVTDGQFSAWKQQHCTQSDHSMSRSAFEYYAQQTLAPEAIEAWRACKLRQQSLSCWVSPRSASQIEFHYSWNSRDVDLPVVRDFHVIQGTSTPRELGRAEDKVYIGEVTTIVPRDGARDTTIILNIVLAQRFAHNCVAYVPRVPQYVRIAQIMGKWCFSEHKEMELAGWGIPAWEVWGQTGAYEFRVVDFLCRNPKGPYPAGGKSCETYQREERMTRSIPFRPVSSNEFEVKFPDRKWERFRMTDSSRLFYSGDNDDSGYKYVPQSTGDYRLTRCN